MSTGTRSRDRTEAPTAPLAGELIDLVSGIRRTVRRQVRRGSSHRPLPPAELELLLLVGERPGLRVQDAAAAIGVAANTVSTLVGRLTSLGLMERRPDDRDGRAARLVLTDAAVRRRAEWRDRRRDVVEAAMRRLDRSDRAAIGTAMAPLRRLLVALEED